MISVNINHIDIKIENGRRRILQNISFQLKEGQIYTILGKNGSGKTTLVNTLTNLLDNTIYDMNAIIKIDDKNLFELNYNELSITRKEKIKYVFQDPINSFNSLKKFKYYFNMLNVSPEETTDLFNFFLLPESNKILNLYPYEVSGGMAQRISICLAILAKPELLIMDEPTSAIDINIANLLRIKLKEFVKVRKSSVLLITQDIDFAEQVSDYTAQLRDGTLSQFIKVSHI